MKKLTVSFSGGDIGITGDIAQIKRRSRRFMHWIRTSGFDSQFNETEIIISSESFSDSKELYSFKTSITSKLSNYHLEFNDSFDEVIQTEINSQNEFKEFSLKAKNIWNNSYDVSDFNEFCRVTKESLPTRRLYKLQTLSGYHMAFSKNACNFSVPGAGKTSIVYSAFAYLKKDISKPVNKLLIIAPPSAFNPWEEEYFECFGRKPKSFRISGEVAIDLKKDTLKGITTKDYDLYLITYNSVPSLIEELLIFLKSELNNVMLVCDEAHKFKNVTGIWGSHILRLAPHAKSRIVLTGTPAPNGYEDLYNIFQFIYPDKNVIGYRADYLSTLSRRPVQSDINQIIENIKPYFVRIKKSDLNLPSYTEHPIISNKLSSLESEVYDQLESELVKAKDSKSGNAQSIHFRMIQVCNNLNLLNKSLRDSLETESLVKFDESTSLEDILGASLARQIKSLDASYIPSKHEAVKNMVSCISKKKQKVIIWGFFIDSIKRLHSYLEASGLKGAYVIGETKKGKRDKDGNLVDDSEVIRERIVKSFKTSDLDYIISNPVVLGESISLHRVCHNAIYFEQGWAVAPYVQSRDRIHRVWLDKNMKQKHYETNYYHILTSKRTDIDIHNCVQAKFKRMMEIIEHDMPFFQEDLNNERDILIQNIIDDYRHRK
jgi:SNF2 family DNA or RNA helicase